MVLSKESAGAVSAGEVSSEELSEADSPPGISLSPDSSAERFSPPSSRVSCTVSVPEVSASSPPFTRPMMARMPEITRNSRSRHIAANIAIFRIWRSLLRLLLARLAAGESFLLGRGFCTFSFAIILCLRDHDKPPGNTGGLSLAFLILLLRPGCPAAPQTPHLHRHSEPQDPLSDPVP